ncbi:hypothetical protein HPB49_026104 [Dermacentor silvarum]|nr:hypothetical protein HPB49_026104 [Dermacentor silvarum]
MTFLTLRKARFASLLPGSLDEALEPKGRSKAAEAAFVSDAWPLQPRWHRGHKVILRPQGGFVLTTLRPAQLMSAVTAAASLTDNEYKETQVEYTEKLAQLIALTIQDTSHQVSIYLAPPDNSCRGVVHRIEAHTASAELMANLDAPASSLPHLRCRYASAQCPSPMCPELRHCNGAHPATDPACPSIQAANKCAYQATRLRRAPRPPPPQFTPDMAASRATHLSAVRPAALEAGLLTNLADDPSPELREATSRAGSRDLRLPVPTLRELWVRGSCRRPQCLRLVLHPASMEDRLTRLEVAIAKLTDTVAELVARPTKTGAPPSFSRMQLNVIPSS